MSVYFKPVLPGDITFHGLGPGAFQATISKEAHLLLEYFMGVESLGGEGEKREGKTYE